MRIKVLIHSLNVRGGTHKQLHRLCEYLIKEGHDVKIITKVYNASKCYPGIERFNITSFDKYFIQNGFFGKIFSFIASVKMALNAVTDAECINIHDNGLETVQILIKLFSRKKVVIWQINDINECFRVGTAKNKNDSFYFSVKRVMVKLSAKFANKITVNVTKNAERIKAIFNKSAQVIFCGVDLRNEYLIDRPLKRDDQIKLISTGIFFKYRNYETLLMVQKALLNKGYDVESTIVGSTTFDEAYAASVKELAYDLGLRCNITGDIAEDKLINYYNQADFFLFLNIDQSWGLAVFEAINLGVPVIVSKSVGATELLTDNTTALIVDPENVDLITEKIIYLLNNPVLNSALRNNAFLSVSNMTWDNMYSSKMLNLFNQLVKC